ncbi:MAG: IMP dehydrogenase [Planctomycetota bacterium]|nr:IMP dehydrogenase [Planctomycetota bacterium]MDI6787706.1 IMP dehydrogenase [Planctomycetota bacterium]
MSSKFIAEGITFDDILLVPQRSEVVPTEVDTKTLFSRHISLNIPIVSSPMDTVTEANLAIALAQEGGIGIIHRNLSIDEQVREVVKVKRSASGIITDPMCLSPDETIKTAKKIMANYHISGIPIVVETSPHKKLVGILTMRDLRFQKSDDKKISEVMTKDNLITAPPQTSLEQAKQILHKNKIEKLLLVDKDNHLKGLITIKDINKTLLYPDACRDKYGRFYVGAAVGVGVGGQELERVEKLVSANVDVIVVDTAHGHSANVINTVRDIKKGFKIDVVAGNVATAEGTLDLIKAGVDGVKVGIGAGSICTTRIIAGIGVPQGTAIHNCARLAEKYKIPIIADGGIRHSGDITKAIALGASSAMIGGLFAGVNESPGEVFFYKGKTYKVYRGMGSQGAMFKGSKDRYGQQGITEKTKLVPEGVEGQIPARGPLSDLVYQLVGGLKAGMGYCGAKNIKELCSSARFIKISNASLKESHPHDIIITREATNYWLEKTDSD